MSKLRMGVIGTGGISATHIRGIYESPDAELTAVCDIDPHTLQQKGDLYQIPVSHRFRSHPELLHCPEVDAVSICTPNDSHYQITLDAIELSKPFALEKPVTLNIEEAGLLQQAAEAKKIPNMVCFSYRFKAAARYARWLIKQGSLGRIYHVYGQYLQSWADSDLPLVWRFEKCRSGSGALGDLGVHMIDLVRFLVGEFTKVSGMTGTFVTSRKLCNAEGYGAVDVDDYCHFLAELEGGIGASFSISRYAYGRGNYQRLEVYGSQGAVIYGLEDQDTLLVCLGDVYKEAKTFTEVPVPSRFKADQMQSFFDIINGKGDGLAATIADGSASQKVADAIIKSFAEERLIKL